MSAEVPWWTRTTTAAVRIVHERCGGTIGTAAPLDAGGLTVAVNEHTDELREIRRGVKGRHQRSGERHLVAATESAELQVESGDARVVRGVVRRVPR